MLLTNLVLLEVFLGQVCSSPGALTWFNSSHTAGFVWKGTGRNGELSETSIGYLSGSTTSRIWIRNGTDNLDWRCKELKKWLITLINMKTVALSPKQTSQTSHSPAPVLSLATATYFSGLNTVHYLHYLHCVSLLPACLEQKLMKSFPTPASWSPGSYHWWPPDDK